MIHWQDPNTGETALHHAVQMGNMNIILLLIQYSSRCGNSSSSTSSRIIKSFVSIQDWYGYTPLHYAVERYVDRVKVAPTVTTTHCDTTTSRAKAAVDMIELDQSIDIIHYLWQNGASWNMLSSLPPQQQRSVVKEETTSTPMDHIVLHKSCIPRDLSFGNQLWANEYYKLWYHYTTLKLKRELKLKLRGIRRRTQ